MAVRAKRRCCLTNINVRIVSGFKLAQRKDIVSRPPEKIRSTVTAEPIVNGKKQSAADWTNGSLYSVHTWYGKNISRKAR